MLDKEFLIDDLLLGNTILASQRLEPNEIGLGLFEKSGVMGELALRKIKRRLEGPGIDLHEKVALVDELAFLEADLHQLAIDLRLNRNGGERRHSSEAGYRLIDLVHCDLRGADRLDILRRALLRGGVRPKKPPGANPEDRGDKQEDYRSKASPALRRHCWLRLPDARKDGLLNLGFGGRQHRGILRDLVGVELSNNSLVLDHIARTNPRLCTIYRIPKVRRPRIVPECEWFVRSKLCYADPLSFKGKLSLSWKRKRTSAS